MINDNLIEKPGRPLKTTRSKRVKHLRERWRKNSSKYYQRHLDAIKERSRARLLIKNEAMKKTLMSDNERNNLWINNIEKVLGSIPKICPLSKVDRRYPPEYEFHEQVNVAKYCTLYDEKLTCDYWKTQPGRCNGWGEFYKCPMFRVWMRTKGVEYRLLDFSETMDVVEDNEDNFQPDPTPEMIEAYEESVKEENEWPTKETEKAALDSLKLIPEVESVNENENSNSQDNNE